MCFPSRACFQELAAGRTTLCGTIVLDMPGDELVSRIGNQVYSLARSDKLSVPSFPRFDPIIQGLREGPNREPTREFRVCAQQHDRLLVLEALASKWTQSETTKDRATEAITEHNKQFNPDGEWWVANRTRGTSASTNNLLVNRHMRASAGRRSRRSGLPSGSSSRTELLLRRRRWRS